MFGFFRGISMEALLAQLHSLDNHSALYILHSLTPLAQFEERKILDLLQQLPNSPGTGQCLHRLLSHLLQSEINFGVNCQQNNVHFFSPAGDTEAVSPGGQRNIVLFQGFCAMKYAIYALCVNAHKYSDCTECESMLQQQQQHQQPSEEEMDQHQTSASSEGTKAGFLLCCEALDWWRMIETFPLC